jgi:hypothetical protein
MINSILDLVCLTFLATALVVLSKSPPASAGL